MRTGKGSGSFDEPGLRSEFQTKTPSTWVLTYKRVSLLLSNHGVVQWMVGFS